MEEEPPDVFQTSFPLISRASSISAALMNEVCTLPLCHVVDGDAVLNADKRLLRGGEFWSDRRQLCQKRW